MKKNFMTGLVILLPLVLTILITLFLVNLLTKPFQGLILSAIGRWNLHFLGSTDVTFILSKIIILLLIAVVLIIFGFFARLFFVRSLFKFGDNILHNIPLINKIYRSIQEVMKTLFSPESTSFTQVVLVPFPESKSWGVGLVTNESLPVGSDKEHMGLVSVFLPAVPNPTMGFVLLYKREQIEFIDMPVDDAICYIVSCGVMYSGFIPNKD